MDTNGLSEVVKSLRVDSKRESYQSFFDHQWIMDLEKAASGLPALLRITLDLALSWRGAANVHHLPWQTIHLLDSFASATLKATNPYGENFKAAFTTRLMAKIGKSLSNMKQKELDKALCEICEDLRNAWENEPSDFDAEAFWKQFFVSNSEIQFTIWSTQRMCYGAIYYAYENFVLGVYRLISGTADYRIKKAKDFRKHFTAVFSEWLCKFCWSDPAIQLAGLVRNTLVHNGGRLTESLKNVNHGFVVEDNEIQITPKDTKALHDLLKERVTKLVKEAATKLRKLTGSDSAS